MAQGDGSGPGANRCNLLYRPALAASRHLCYLLYRPSFIPALFCIGYRLHRSSLTSPSIVYLLYRQALVARKRALPLLYYCFTTALQLLYYCFTAALLLLYCCPARHSCTSLRACAHCLLKIKVALTPLRFHRRAARGPQVPHPRRTCPNNNKKK